MVAAAKGLGAIGKAAKATGLDKLGPWGVGIVGLGAIEGIKYGVINPTLEATGVKKPSYVPPPAMSSYEQLMLGTRYDPGFFGINAQKESPGLIERRFNNDMEIQRNAQVMADRLARMHMENNSPVALANIYADRDRYSASQNALASISASMANAASGSQSYATNIGYSQTPLPQFNPQAGMMAAQSMRGGRFGRGRGNRYGIDTSGYMPPGMPMTPELREQMMMSPEQMGQFSGRNGAIARAYDSAKFGMIDNAVPMGVDNYAMGYASPNGRRRMRG